MNNSELRKFLRHVRINELTGCWEWTQYVSYYGYGQARSNGKHIQAHRLSYEHYVGPIAPKMQIDHTCSVKHCVNPDHLQQVTACENMNLAVEKKENYRSAQTHCKRGHEYNKDNSYRHKPPGRISAARVCRVCQKLRNSMRKK